MIRNVWCCVCVSHFFPLLFFYTRIKSGLPQIVVVCCVWFSFINVTFEELLYLWFNMMESRMRSSEGNCLFVKGKWNV